MKNIFNLDTSSAGNTVNAAINTYLAIGTPALTDLVTLREAIYVYQEYTANLGSNNAYIDVLLRVVKSFIYDYQLGVTSSVQIGTLGSAYSCSSLSDTHPTLIATGSSDVIDSIIVSKQCNKWSQQALTEWGNTGSNMVDSSLANVYMSTSSSGGCFEVIGSMWTTPVTVPVAQYNNPTTTQLHIPSLQITCASGSCATEPTPIFTTKASTPLSFLLPSMPITCTSSSMSSCSTAPIMISNSYTLTIPSQSLVCSSSTCNFPSIVVTIIYDAQGNTFTYPAQTISCSGSICTIPAIYTAVTTSGVIYYVPVRSVTYDSTTSVYNTDPITVTNVYLTIPSISVTCSTPGSTCANIASQTITDSAGNSVSIPSRSISCVSSICKTAVQAISMSGSDGIPWVGSFSYNVPSQYVECDDSTCSIPEITVYSGSSTTIYFATIPSLPVYSIGASAASLRGVCENMLDS